MSLQNLLSKLTKSQSCFLIQNVIAIRLHKNRISIPTNVFTSMNTFNQMRRRDNRLSIATCAASPI